MSSAIEAIEATDQLRLAKNFLVRSLADEGTDWEVSWGEGAGRCYYRFPRDLAVFFMTCLPHGTREEWIARLSGEVGVQSDDAAGLVDSLVEAGLLAVGPPGWLTPGEEQWLEVEWSDALQLHWAERDARWEHDYTNNPKVMTRFSGENVLPSAAPPGPFQCVPAPGKTAVVLPDTVDLDMPFQVAQEARRTAYQFKGTTISLSDVSTILQWTLRARWSDGVSPLRVTQSYSRGEPFIGFVAFGDDPPQGCAERTIYQYDPASNVLAPLANDAPPTWSEWLWGQQFGDDAPMALILVANWEHFMWKYRFPRAYRWVYTECGSFMQTALTVAAGLGMRTWLTPALDDERVRHALALEEDTAAASYLAVFGRPGRGG